MQLELSTLSHLSKSKVDNTNISSPPPMVARLKGKSVSNEKRYIYGGKNDPTHLGGFIERDNNTISENLFKFMLGLNF